MQRINSEKTLSPVVTVLAAHGCKKHFIDLAVYRSVKLIVEAFGDRYSEHANVCVYDLFYVPPIVVCAGFCFIN